MIQLPQTTTKRLVLRRPKASDAESILRNYASDPTVTHFLPWKPHRDIADTHAFLSEQAERVRQKKEVAWAITEIGSPEVLGMINAYLDEHKAMIGYVLAPSRWGKGYMTEALVEMIRWACAQPELHRVWAFCEVGNRASARVMEKAGMRYEATLANWVVARGAPVDCRVYVADAPETLGDQPGSTRASE